MLLVHWTHQFLRNYCIPSRPSRNQTSPKNGGSNGKSPNWWKIFIDFPCLMTPEAWLAWLKAPWLKICGTRSLTWRPSRRRSQLDLASFNGMGRHVGLSRNCKKFPGKTEKNHLRKISPAHTQKLPETKENLRLTGIHVGWQVAQPPSLVWFLSNRMTRSWSVTESSKRWNYSPESFFGPNCRWKDWKSVSKMVPMMFWGVLKKSVSLLLSCHRCPSSNANECCKLPSSRNVSIAAKNPPECGPSLPRNHSCVMLWYNPMSVASYLLLKKCQFAEKLTLVESARLHRFFWQHTLLQEHCQVFGGWTSMSMNHKSRFTIHLPAILM